MTNNTKPKLPPALQRLYYFGILLPVLFKVLEITFLAMYSMYDNLVMGPYLRIIFALLMIPFIFLGGYMMVAGNQKRVVVCLFLVVYVLFQLHLGFGR